MGQKPFAFVLHSAIAVLALHSSLLASDQPLFSQKTTDKRLHREVLANGDFCQVRLYTGDSHQGLRVAYFIPERTLDESALRTLIQSLILKWCGKRETPLLTNALAQFKPEATKDPDRWFIQIKNPDYSECFIAVNWLGESITVEIKYYQ